MPEPMEIPLRDAVSLRDALLEGAEAAERTAEATERAAKAVREAERASRAANRSSSPAGTGPFSRAETARKAFEAAQSRGVTGNTLSDLRYRAEQSQKAVDRLKPKGFADRLADVAGGSRFSMLGGKLLPRVSQAAELFGGSGAMGRIAGMAKNPWILAAGLVVEGGRRLYEELDKVASRAAEVGRRFAEARTMAGTNAQGAGNLRAFGISGEQARALSERIASDPAAAMMAQRMGAHSIGGPYGTLDSAPNAMKIVEGLRRLPEAERLRAMRLLGAEGLAPMTRVGDETMGRLRGDARLSGQLMGPDFERRTAEFDVSKERMEKAMENLQVALGRTVMPAVTFVANSAADVLNGLARMFGGSGSGDVMEKVNGHLDKNASATEENTAAINRLTKAWGMTQRGTEALPGSLTGPAGRGDALLRANEKGALRLGTL